LYYDSGSGEISYAAKSFIIDHPKTPETHYLVHACLEGPEAGVYYRGEATITNNEFTKIKLPKYVESLANDFTIQITSIYSKETTGNTYETSRVKNNSFEVYGKNGSFFWVVYGKRNNIDVEPLKSKIVVSGDGPYKYISGYK
jgi:hypothetical protein